MKLHYQTVTPLLHEILEKLMAAPQLTNFRLVGGTSLSLRLGHRESVDIDLFTPQEYDTVNWQNIYDFFEKKFAYVYSTTKAEGNHSFGESFYLGNSEREKVKVDLFYTDPFLKSEEIIDNIRIASLDDIVAMKVDVIARGGRKKDFWDLHELLTRYTLCQMLDLHQKRYPYLHERQALIHNFTNFEIADTDFAPRCLKGKYWELIKMDFDNLIQKEFE